MLTFVTLEFYFEYEEHKGVKYMTPGDFHYFEEAEVHPAHALNLTKSKRTRWGQDCPPLAPYHLLKSEQDKKRRLIKK